MKTNDSDDVGITKLAEIAEAEPCKDGKIVAASQTTKTNGHTDPIDGLLITCETGELVWAKE